MSQRIQVENKEELNNHLKEISKMMEEHIKEYDEACKKIWDSFDSDDQLKLFCAVVSKLYKGELEDNGTYRYILYNIFGFGPEAYGAAQFAGFLALHNAIMSSADIEDLKKEFEKFCEENNVPKEKSKDFIQNIIIRKIY